LLAPLSAQPPPSEARRIASVELLVSDRPQPLEFTQSAEALVVQLPAVPIGEHAFAFRIRGLSLPPAP
jgi:hypothetical protein